jgi:ribosomal protein S18 acetylase RimI-like enzyme
VHERITAAGNRFDPSLWFLALDGDEIAGVAICTPEARAAPELGYVSALGVRRPWRRRGLARALLLQTFATFRERGRPGVALHVDAANPTGALALYEGVGMTALPRFEIWEKPLPR